MKTIIATAALTVMFLSAGAFAGNNHRVVLSAASLMGSNVTVVEKNQAFPVLGLIVVVPCQTEDCSEA
jgi:hypothetical protein